MRMFFEKCDLVGIGNPYLSAASGAFVFRNHPEPAAAFNQAEMALRAFER
jgi:hypothetical protein